MSETWYRAGGVDGRDDAPIQEVQVYRVTDASVWVDGKTKRYPRIGWRGAFFPTYTEAREHLIRSAEQAVTQRQVSLEWEQKYLEEAQKLLAKARALPERPVPPASGPEGAR